MNTQKPLKIIKSVMWKARKMMGSGSDGEYVMLGMYIGVITRLKSYNLCCAHRIMV